MEQTERTLARSEKPDRLTRMPRPRHVYWGVQASTTDHIPVSNNEPLIQRDSLESDVSPELQQIFDRRNSQWSSSRKSSQSTLLDQSSRKGSRDMMALTYDRQPRGTSCVTSIREPRRTSYVTSDTQPRRSSCVTSDRQTRRTSCVAFDRHSRRASCDIQEFNRERRRRSHDSFYGRRKESSSHSNIPQFRKYSHNIVSGTSTRRLSREIPMQPIFEQKHVTTRRHSRVIDEPLRHYEGSSHERSRNYWKHERRHGSRIQHAKSSDYPNFWLRNESPDLEESRSLLLRRKFLSTAAVSSLDSTNSTESSAPDAMFVSSVDSGGSDLEHRRLSLMNRISTGSVPQIMSRPPPWVNEPSNSQQRRRLNDRDYSVDEQSDTLFREWSRVDPAYEERDVRVHRQPRRQLNRGVSENHSPLRVDRQRPYTRQFSVNPRSSNVMVPLIRYPDEDNCSR
ncbi:hypothetical protein KIN20_032981 [Parelaphostrongylus tenuis]|uniref:Uncharacterized protein n=1 Tax=Parelaphostrongylus tenuis TaxID=148309 RepID=A0AAD5R7U4_PARTN|nr:hypothetical protein KIN20_032981 [Parelaphostrongylus tenuis]